MSETNKRVSTSIPLDHLLKRRRGQPPREEIFFENQKSQWPQHVEIDLNDDIDDEMVGQLVTGVIEGTFDAGYFLSIRVGNSGTLLRGVVFQPGRFTPVTTANDVAPHVKMYKRRQFPIPDLNSQSDDKNNDKWPPPLPTRVLPSELQCSNEIEFMGGTLLVGRVPKKQNSMSGSEKQSTPQPVTQSKSKPIFPLPKRSAIFKLPVTNALLNCNLQASLEAKRNMLQQQKSEFSHQSRSSSQFPLPKQSAPVTMPPTLGGKNMPQRNSGGGLEKLSASAAIPPTLGGKNMPQQNSASATIPSTSGGKNMPQQNYGFGLEKQSASVSIPPTLGGTNAPQQNAGCGLENRSASATIPPPLGGTNVPQQNYGCGLGKRSTSATIPPTLGGTNVPQQNSGCGLEKRSASATIPPSLGGKNMPQQNSNWGLEKQSVSRKQRVTLPLADNLAKNNSVASWRGKEKLKNNFESSLEKRTQLSLSNQSASLMVPPANNLDEGKDTEQEISGLGLEDLLSTPPRLDSDRITREGKKMRELETSALLERPKIHFEGTKDAIPEITTELTVGFFPRKVNMNQVPTVEHQAMGLRLGSSGLVRDELKSLNLVLHQSQNGDKPWYPPHGKPASHEKDTPLVTLSD